MKTTIAQLIPGDRIRVNLNKNLFDDTEIAIHHIDPDGIHLTPSRTGALTARVLSIRCTGAHHEFPRWIVKTSLGDLDVLGTQPVSMAGDSTHEIRRAFNDALTEDRARRAAAAAASLDAMMAADEAENRVPAWA